MPIDSNDTGSRSAKRAKRRKTNIILNTLIAIVIILILIVGGSIFFGGDNADDQQTEEAKITDENEKQDTIASKERDEKDKEESSNIESDDITEENDEETAEEDEEVIETESDEPNVESVIVNPGWTPVGTEQVSGHQPSYTKGTVDWNEKLRAVSYAAEIPEDAMILWWIEGGENPTKQSIATVSARGGSDTYRVYIEWIEGEGWKPTEVKKLIENDKR